MVSKLLCWLMGHRWEVFTSIDNSSFTVICKRCLKCVGFDDEDCGKEIEVKDE